MPGREVHVHARRPSQHGVQVGSRINPDSSVSISVKSSQFVTKIYRKSSTGVAFQVNLNQIYVGWKKRSVSTNGLSMRIGGYALRALSTLHFGSGSSGLGLQGRIS